MSAASRERTPATAILYCSYVPAGPYRADCIGGAVQDRFWELSRAPTTLLAMCAMIEDVTEQDVCYSTIIVRARDLYCRPTEGVQTAFAPGSIHAVAELVWPSVVHG